MVHGMDGSDSRNERMILKVVAHLGDSDRKYNPVALSQLAEAWPSSRTVSVELGAIGAYSFNQRGREADGECQRPAFWRCALAWRCLRCRDQLDFEHVHGQAHGGVCTLSALPDDHCVCEWTGGGTGEAAVREAAKRACH